MDETLKMKNLMSATPLRAAPKALIMALKILRIRYWIG